MKKNIKRLCLLSLILITISITIIQVTGKTYTTKFLFNTKYDYKLELENETGKVKIIEEKVEKGKYLVKVKAQKPGKALLILNIGGLQEGKTLYIHKNMVITESSYFGKSTCSEVIPISILIITCYILYLLIKKYTKSKKENLYQYNNIAYLGIIIFMSFFAINNIFQIFNYSGFIDTIRIITTSISFVSSILFPVALITFIPVTISNINLIRKEGKSFKNLLGLFLGIFICISTLLPDYIYSILQKSPQLDIHNLNSLGPYLYNFFETLIYLTITYLECILIATIIIAIKSVYTKIKYNKDYMIILGCQIKKDGTLTPLLKGRVDKAIEFRNEQLKQTGKDLIFIPSGGKGKDEVTSEAEAMKKYLLKKGIEEKNIIVEDKSTNTYTNIKNSYKLIKNKKANIAFSTTKYHILRAGLIATSQGIILEGIGSKTKAYFWINAFIREFIGTIYSERKKHIIVFIIIIIIIILTNVLYYIDNNI